MILKQGPRADAGVVAFGAWGPSGVYAGFTTRRFGCFLKNTADLTGPSKQAGFREAFRSEGNFPSERFVFLNQVHGDRVASLEDPKAYAKEGFYRLDGTDAVISNVPGLTLLVLTADCLPLFFKAPGWVGLAHAGWRGTRQAIAAKLYRTLREKSKAPAKAIEIVFGPCIRREEYEVGLEFKEHFKGRSLVTKGEKLFFDLPGENRRQLLEAGASGETITDEGLSSFAAADLFYSYRREQDASGRTVSFIGIAC